jgi:hypothetical protein
MADLVTRILLDNKQFNDNIERSKKQVESFKNIQNNVLGTLGKFAGAIGIAGTAIQTFDKLIHSSQTTADAWDKTIGAAKASVDTFFTSLATGDFTSFFDGLEGIISKSNEAIAALDQLGNTRISYNYKIGGIDDDIASSKRLAMDKENSNDIRNLGFSSWNNQLGLKNNAVGSLQNRIEDTINKLVTKNNLLEPNSISKQDIDKIMSIDLLGNPDDVKKQLSAQYSEYQKHIKNLQAEKDIYRDAQKNSFGVQVNEKRIKEINEEEKALTKSYKTAILFQDLLVKDTDEELTNIVNLSNEYHNLGKTISEEQLAYDKALYKFKNGKEDGKSGKVEEIISAGSIAELNKKLKDLNDQFLKTSSKELREQLDSDIRWVESQKVKLTFEAQFPTSAYEEKLKDLPMAGITKGTDISKIKLKPVITSQDVKNNNEYLDGLNTMSSVMGNLTGIFDSNANSVLQWASNTISAAASIIPAIQAVTLAKKQEAVAGGIASAASTPLVGWLMVAGAAAAVLAAFSSIPQMADGGIVYKNSLVNVAEYGNASSNPEVIAPLNKLKSLLHNDTDTSNGYGEVRFKIDGTTLIGVLNNYNRKTSKVR